MDLQLIINQLKNCSCGRKHTSSIKCVEIGRGLVHKTGEILLRNSFPTKILIVADENTLSASQGILENLEKSGFNYKIKIYNDLRVADMVDVLEVVAESTGVDGILSVGSGSLNDICRLASYMEHKEFAIFATAPSMDGFASGTAPITTNGFKETKQAKQPSVIIGDTDILAKSPAELKAAGFGDMAAKYIALVDWKVSALTTGEYYCENIANLTREALDRMIALADKVTQDDAKAAGAIMEALVFTGIAMKLAESVRPASGTEHIISHFWEMKKLEQGKLSDFHGKKVGVATLISNRIYHFLAEHENINPKGENLDWDKIYLVYGENLKSDILRLNSPTVTTETTPEKVLKSWQEIRMIVKEELPTDKELSKLMTIAGAAKTVKDIKVDYEMGVLGVEYHPYMRHRLTLMRLIPMLGIDVDFMKFVE